MNEERIQIEVSQGRTVTAIRTTPDDPGDRLFIYAPGAGSNINDGFGAFVSHALAEEGISTLRFQFLYMEAGKRRPDSPSVLEETWRQVTRAAEPDGLRLAVGGRSMGGRIASQIVASGTAADRLALFAYPLRPPWRPEQLRDEHLPDIGAPTLFCSGARDQFATPEELRAAAAKVPRPTVHILEGADHGFNVLKSSGRTRDEVWGEAADVLLAWLK